MNEWNLNKGRHGSFFCYHANLWVALSGVQYTLAGMVPLFNADNKNISQSDIYFYTIIWVIYFALDLEVLEMLLKSILSLSHKIFTLFQLLFFLNILYLFFYVLTNMKVIGGTCCFNCLHTDYLTINLFFLLWESTATHPHG